jgi:3-deoxy-D-arabino-heptulosonate 7-phosphate (DAHP) synthase
MIYDVSHAPGDKKIKNPFYVGEHKTEIERYTYEVLSDKNTRPSGLIAEASPDPEKAKTDSKQHLDVNELACLCILINSFAS